MSLPETLTLPGAVDLHVHFREPSTNSAETIESGTRAALLGGYVLVADMPNNPKHETWSEDRILEKHRIIRETAYIPVATYAGSQPDHDNVGELAKMAPHAIGLKLYGAPTTGNDRDFTADDFRPIVTEWHRVAPDKPIMLHAGKENLIEMIDLVAKEKNHTLHVCHVNDPKDVEFIEDAKAADLDVTCGVCPHHLLKTSHDVATQGWFARMQPPLADQVDVDKLFYQLVSGDIDVVETDHAPHTVASKWKAEQDNPEGIHDQDHTTCFGVPGIEFAVPLLLYQYKRGRIPLDRIVAVTSTTPARILGANIRDNTTVTWSMSEYRINNENDDTMSDSGWTPYLGMLALGVVQEATIGGRPTVVEEWPNRKTARIVSRRGEEV